MSLYKGMYRRSQPLGRQAEQVGAAADIEKTFALQIAYAQHITQGLFRLGNARVVQYLQESPPVGAKCKALAFRDFVSVLHHLCH